MEDGWQKRQEWQANRTNNRTLQMLWKNLQISVEQEKDLRSTLPRLFFLSILSAVALLENCVRSRALFEIEHVISQKRTVYSRSMLLEQRNPKSFGKHFS